MARINYNPGPEPNRNLIAQEGPVKIYEYKKDLSVTPESSIAAYYASEMNVRKRQAFIELNGSEFIIQAGAMQWTCGNVESVTNVKGVGDMFKKFASSKVTGESAIKPKYRGMGTLVLEPTYRYLLLDRVENWAGGMVIEDGMFLGCEGSVDTKVVARSSISSAVAGGEGLFNLCMVGNGVVLLESRVPREELIEVELENDELKIDGNYAVAWSNTLKFTVERSTKTLIGSAASGEGLVNVYRGTGRVLMAPL